MPANKSFKKYTGKQRHHKHRVGRMLVPHGGVSGLIFTANPRQESKALRELRLYLHPIIADLEMSSQAEQMENKQLGSDKHLRKENTGDLSSRSKEEMQESTALATSTLLAAELKQYIQRPVGWHNNNKKNANIFATENSGEASDLSSANEEHADGGGGGGDDTNTALLPSRKRLRHDTRATKHVTDNCHQWLAPLETGCKGHIMVSIPFALDKHTASEEKMAANAEQIDSSEIIGGSTLNDAAVNSGESETSGLFHKVSYNPLVRLVVERIFKDIEENPRPLLRHCFRLMPCELSCCPTLPEMRSALEHLIVEHFPLASEPKRLHCVGLSFKVKNNTGVEQKKTYLQAVLESTFPTNRFVVVSAAQMKGSDIALEAMFCVFVAHATCVMGVQRLFTKRAGYNLHAISAKHLELSSSV